MVADIFTTHPLFAVPNAKELAEEKAEVQTLSRISHCLANGAAQLRVKMERWHGDFLTDILLQLLCQDAQERLPMSAVSDHLDRCEMGTQMDTLMANQQQHQRAIASIQAQQQCLLYRICPLLEWLSEFNAILGLTPLLPGDFIQDMSGAQPDSIRLIVMYGGVKLFNIQKHLGDNPNFEGSKSTAELVATALETTAIAPKDDICIHHHGGVAHHTGPTPWWQQAGCVVKEHPNQDELENFHLFGSAHCYKVKGSSQTRNFKKAPVEERHVILDRVADRIRELGWPLQLNTGNYMFDPWNSFFNIPALGNVSKPSQNKRSFFQVWCSVLGYMAPFMHNNAFST